MKKFIYTLATILCVGLSFISCSQDYLDDLTGKYTTPEAKTFTTATYTRTLEGSNFHFNVTLSNGSETLNIEFVDSKYYLLASTYYNHASVGIGEGQFATESTSFNGTPCAAENGMVFVTNNGDDYTIDGNVWLNDGRIIHATWSGKLTFEEYIPDLGYTFSNTTGVVYSSGAPVAGVVDNTLKIYNGADLLANLEFSTATGSTIEGTYTITSTYGAAGTANNGWDFSGYGYGFGGSYTMTSSGTKNFLSSGTIEITKKLDAYRIVVGSQDFGLCHEQTPE